MRSFAQIPFIKETKGVPLEEIDAIFGDGENVAVYSKDIVLDEVSFGHYIHQDICLLYPTIL